MLENYQTSIIAFKKLFKLRNIPLNYVKKSILSNYKNNNRIILKFEEKELINKIT